jgi:hypothetical protein
MKRNGAMLGVLWILCLQCARGDDPSATGSNAFDANAATSLVTEVTVYMEAAWNQVYTLTSAFDSGMLGSGTLKDSKRSGHRGSHVNQLVDDNATREFIWANFKKVSQTNLLIVQKDKLAETPACLLDGRNGLLRPNDRLTDRPTDPPTHRPIHRPTGRPANNSHLATVLRICASLLLSKISSQSVQITSVSAHLSHC